MNDIVKKAGGSLATLYKHFGNKEQLFITVLEQRNKSLFEVWDRLSSSHDGQLEQFLYAIGRNFLDLITGKEAVLFHRMIVSVGYMNDEELSSNIMKSIMSRPTSIIAAFLDKEKKRGVIEVEDTLLCAQQFLHALKEPFMLPRLLGISIDTSLERKELALKQIISIFYNGLVVRH